MSFKIIFYEDSLINYFVHLVGKSFYYLKERVGYYHLKGTQSITRKVFKYKYIHIKCLFIYLKFTFENIKNSQYSKDQVNQLMSSIKEDTLSILSRTNLTEDINLYNNITNAFLSSSFINRENKYLLLEIKEITKRNS